MKHSDILNVEQWRQWCGLATAWAAADWAWGQQSVVLVNGDGDSIEVK